MPGAFTSVAVERLLESVYVAAEGATLRTEERRKAALLAALLEEVRRAARHSGHASELVLVDAAAGKSYVGVLAAQLVLAPLGRPARVAIIEREAARAEAGMAAARRLGVALECHVGDVADPAVWPEAPTIVVALHACGAAADAIIERAAGARARHILLVPCCTGAGVSAAAVAERTARALGVPRHAPVRRRFVQAIVDAERTLRLEAAGYETEVVELVPPTMTPHNLLWRARRVGEPGRSRAAAAALARLRGG